MQKDWAVGCVQDHCEMKNTRLSNVEDTADLNRSYFHGGWGKASSRKYRMSSVLSSVLEKGK